MHFNQQVLPGKFPHLKFVQNEYIFKNISQDIINDKLVSKMENFILINNILLFCYTVDKSATF